MSCVPSQPGPVPPRHQPPAALLLLPGLRHQAVGPAHQRVCVRPAEPLQRRHLSGLQPRRQHHDQVLLLPADTDKPPALIAVCFSRVFESGALTASSSLFLFRSSGRDKVCTVWDLKSRKAKRTVPVYEVKLFKSFLFLKGKKRFSCSFIIVFFLSVQAVEGVMLLPGKKDFSQIGVLNKDLHFVTAGSKGSSSRWQEASSGRVSDLLAPHVFVSPLLTSFQAC